MSRAEVWRQCMCAAKLNFATTGVYGRIVQVCATQDRNKER